MNGLTHGVYVIGSQAENRCNLMTAAWVTQISARPDTLLVAVGKTHYTAQLITQRRSFTVSALSEKQGEIARACGFVSGRDINKLARVHCGFTESGLPWVWEAAAMFECEMTGRIEMGDHILFVGTVIESRSTGATPMVYRASEFFPE